MNYLKQVIWLVFLLCAGSVIAQTSYMQIDFTISTVSGSGIRVTCAGESEDYITDGFVMMIKLLFSQEQYEAGISFTPIGIGAHITSMECIEESYDEIVRYIRDANGYVVAVYKEFDSQTIVTYYVHDGAGNVVATYKN